MYSHLIDALTHELCITFVTSCESFDTSLNTSPSLHVSKCIEPSGKQIGLSDLSHPSECSPMATLRQ